MSTGLLGNVSLGAINNVANTTFQDLYYNAGNPTGSSILWSAGSGAVFGGAGYIIGNGSGKLMSVFIPVYNKNTAALLQKPNTTATIWSNIFGGGSQGAGSFVKGPDNNRVIP